MMADDPGPEADQVGAFIIAKGELERLQSYLHRSRKLEGLSDPDLETSFVQACRDGPLTSETLNPGL
jgi:hypothetical protein